MGISNKTEYASQIPTDPRADFHRPPCSSRYQVLEPSVVTPEEWKQEPGRVHSAFFDGAGAGKAGGSGVLMVVNPSPLPVEVRFESLWADRNEVIREILSGRPLVLKNGVLIDSLPPQGGARLRRYCALTRFRAPGRARWNGEKIRRECFTCSEE
jgi:hypothetical protein